MKNSKGMIVLLVALAALTVVVAVGVFFFYPKDEVRATTPATPPVATGPAATTPGTPLPSEFDPVEWTRNPQTTPLQTPAPTDPNLTVTLPAEKTPATQALPPSPGAAFPGETTAPAVTTPAKTPAPAKTPVVTPKPVPPVKKTAAAHGPQYWIQVGSFKDRYQAENTAKSLEAQGLKGTLSTATVNGQAVVRVRVGPYANEKEAGKFLTWLKPVKAFEASYITKTAAPQAN